MTITGDKNTLNLGDTVKLTITSLNNGPKSADVKVDYKIPFDLKLLSSQGTGTYDSSTGIWSVGILPAGGNATMELILQATNAGYFVNLVSVYGDLALFSTKSLSSSPKRVVKAWSVKAASSMPDSNPGNNQARYDLTSVDPGQTSNANILPYDFPDNIKPPNQDNSPKKPDDPLLPPDKPPEPPDYGPLYPKTQLDRDVAAVREAISRGELNKSVLPKWNLTTEEKVDDWETFSMMVDIAAELLYIGSIASTPGSGEYLQQVKNGMIEAMSSLKMAARYFTTNPQRAFDLLKRGFQQAGKSFVDGAFMEVLSKKTFRLDPNVAQTLLQEALCKIFPKQAAQIRTLLTLLGGINFISDPLEIYKAWGDVVYSFVVDGIGQGIMAKLLMNSGKPLKKRLLIQYNYI